MNTAFAVVFLTFAVILAAEAKPRSRSSGGRHGGSGSRSTFFGGGKKSRSSSSNINSQHNLHVPAPSSIGRFVDGFIHSAPYHYNPSHIGSSHYHSYSGISYRNNYNEDIQSLSAKNDNGIDKMIQETSNQGETNYAVGNAVSHALNNDFLSIFHMVDSISKFTQKLQSNDLDSQLTTTTSSSELFTTTIPTTLGFQ